MDPITICAGAFTAIKAGVSAGKEVQELAQHIGKMWGAIYQVRKDHTSARNSLLGASAEEEAMQTFINLQKAKDYEDQLREIILATRGYGAWQELLKLRGEIKQKRLKAQRAREIKKQELLENIGKVILALLGVAAAALVTILSVLWYRKGQDT